MMPQFPRTWQGFFAPPAVPAFAVTQQPLVTPLCPRSERGASVPARPLLGGYAISRQAAPRSLRGHSRDGGGTSSSGVNRWQAELPRRTLELAWLTCQMPEHMREAAIFNLRQTLDWRAQHCKPLKAPKKPLAITRFGLLGEQLWPKGALTVRRTLKKEARESVRLMEGTQPHLERNHLLAMRGARLGQLCVDLEERGLDALEMLRCELTWLWE